MKISYILAAILVAMLINVSYLKSKLNKLENTNNTLLSNQEILNNTLAKEKDTNKVLQYNTKQLSYYNDSILVEMNKLKQELGIKDKNLKNLQYLQSISTKKDTVLFTDTIFKDTHLALDTLIGDKWYNVRLGIKYPNLISINPTFVSEKYIVTSKKKETINPPKKFFLLRWFQKKHWVMEVHIKEKNPYIKETNNKFVEIIE